MAITVLNGAPGAGAVNNLKIGFFAIVLLVIGLAVMKP